MTCSDSYPLSSFHLIQKWIIFVTEDILKPVAQRHEMVFGTLALLTHLLMVASQVRRAAAPKGTKSYRIQGESLESLRPYDFLEAGLGLPEAGKEIPEANLGLLQAA